MSRVLGKRGSRRHTNVEEQTRSAGSPQEERLQVELETGFAFTSLPVIWR